jgi:hypothetical protein
MPKKPRGERELPLGGKATWVARWLWTTRRYGPGGVLRCDAVLVKRRLGHKDEANPKPDPNP